MQNLVVMDDINIVHGIHLDFLAYGHDTYSDVYGYNTQLF